MELLALLLIVVVLAAASIVVPVALVLHRVVIANRIHRRVRTPAPLSWLVSPAPVPRLHRRLRTALALAEMARVGGHDDSVDELVAEAAALDATLVMTSRYRSHERRLARRGLEQRVLRIEDLARRLVAVSQPMVEGSAIDRLDVIDERLTALEQARLEIDRLTRDPSSWSARGGHDEAVEHARRNP